MASSVQSMHPINAFGSIGRAIAMFLSSIDRFACTCTRLTPTEQRLRRVCLHPIAQSHYNCRKCQTVSLHQGLDDLSQTTSPTNITLKWRRSLHTKHYLSLHTICKTSPNDLTQLSIFRLRRYLWYFGLFGFRTSLWESKPGRGSLSEIELSVEHARTLLILNSMYYARLSNSNLYSFSETYEFPIHGI